MKALIIVITLCAFHATVENVAKAGVPGAKNKYYYNTKAPGFFSYKDQQSMNELNLVKVNRNNAFYTYKWTKYQLKADTTIIPLSDYEIGINGNAKYTVRKNLLLILAFDTNEIQIEISPNEQSKTIHSFRIKAKYNPFFREEWNTLKPGEIPTPLTEEEYKTFRTFSSFILLHKMIPDFELYTPHGKVITRNSFIGKITLLNFWYSPCPPCIAEIPTLNEIKSLYKENKEIQFLSFFRDSIYLDENNRLLFETSGYSTYEGGKNKPRAIFFDFEQVSCTKEVNEKFNVRSYPTNMIIDRDGIIRDITIGAAVDGENKFLKEKIINNIEKLKQIQYERQ